MPNERRDSRPGDGAGGDAALRDPDGASEQPGGWLFRLGLRSPRAHQESERHYRQSKELFTLARQVGLATQCPEDGAPLVRKAIYRLFVAVLRLDRRDTSSQQRCRDQIEASGEYRKLFGGVLDDLPLLDEVIRSADPTTSGPQEPRDRYVALLERMPAQQQSVRRHLDGRVRQAGGSPALRRAATGVAIGGAALLLFWIVYSQTAVPDGDSTAAAAPAVLATVQPGPPVAPDVRADASRCFRGTYFADQNFEKPVFSRRDCAIEFDWNEGAPEGAPGIAADHFSVRWEGLLRVTESADYTFYVTSDDGSRLYLDDGLLVDNWGEHPLQERASAPVPLQPGRDYRIRLDYYEDAAGAGVQLQWSSAKMAKATLSGRNVWLSEKDRAVAPSADEPEPPEVLNDSSKCLAGRYYRGVDFETLVQERRDCRIDFTWMNDPVPGIEQPLVDHFSVRWDGTLRVPQTGEYVFYLASDDGSRLYLGNELIIDDWSDHPDVERASPPQTLEQGIAYPFRVEYYENENMAVVRLLWSSSTLSKRLLSGRYLAPSSPSASPSAGASR